MSKVLDVNCTWDLTWDGKKINSESGGLDDQGLDSFLLKNLNKIDFNGEAIFYSKSLLDVAMDKIATIKQDLGNSQVAWTKVKDNVLSDEDSPDGLEIYYKIPGSIGVTKAITSLNINDGSPLVTPMSLDNWRTKKINDYKSGEKMTSPAGVDLQNYLQISGETPEHLTKLEEKSWEKLTSIGIDVHAVFESIFKGEEPKNQGIPESIFNSLVSQIQSFKHSLELKYPGCRFECELGIKSKNLSPDMQTMLSMNNLDSINGVIDLLVIDANGVAHVYDYKVSRKGVGKSGMDSRDAWNLKDNVTIRESKLWASTKKLTAEYQIEFYRQMLKQYEFNVADVNIVPIKLDLTYDNPKNPFEVTGIDNITVNYDNNSIIKNPALWGNSTRYQRIENLFASAITTTPDDIDKMGNSLDYLIPKNSTLVRREDMRSNIEYYKQQDRYVHKLKPGERGYGEDGKEYRIKFPGYGAKTTYCKESEVDTKLQDFINNQSNLQSTQYLQMASELESIKNGNDDGNLMAMFSKTKTQNFVRKEFEKYYDDSWTFVKDDASNSVGLQIFKKGNKAEIVVLSGQALNTLQKLGKGTSLLGKTQSDKNIDSREVPYALTGNIELMKAMIYISMHPEIFKSCKIAEIKCINPWHGNEKTLLNSQLVSTFNKLLDENPASGLSKINASMFLDDRVALVESAKEELDGVDQLLDTGGDTVDYYSQKWFESKIKLFENKYGKDMDLRGGYQDTPEWNVYVKLQEGLNLTKGFKTHSELDKGDYITDKFFELNGLMISSPQFSSSANIRELGQAIDEFAKEVRKQVFTIGAPIQQHFKKVYEKYGTSANVFNNWFADRENLILKDPDSAEFAGDEVSREALRCFLKTMAQLRHPEYKTEKDFENAKNEDDYYAIPLLEAAVSRQIKNLGLWKALKNKAKEKYTVVEGLFMGQEVEGGMSQYVSDHQELYNKLKYDNMEARQARLNEFGWEMFETDLERLMNNMLVAFCRSNVSQEYIPAIAGLRLSLEYKDAHGSNDKTVNMQNVRKRFDDIVKSKFYGESIVPKNLQQLLKFLNMIKAGFTTLTLSLNVRSFLRESLQGIYTGLSRAGVKLYPGITEKYYTEGLTYVIQEAHKNFSGVSMLQQLNAVYGMANQSLAQLAGQRRLNWAHINHWGKDTLFLTATSPDFMHRMSLLVAKMMSDGCFEAHSIDENGVLVYDFKKDKRFQHLINNDTDSPEYIKEKSLYLTMIDDFNRTGFKNPDGSDLNGENLDALPQAYTRQEGQSIKNYADFLYGHYDDESRSLLCDTMFGSIFLQYKTFLTAKLEQWTMHEGVYNIAQLEPQLDDNGDQMYVRFYEDENGTPHKEVILKSEYDQLDDETKQTCRLYYDYTGLPMQGMLQESMNVYKSVLSFDQDKINEIWSDPTTRAMFKLQLHDLWLMAFMTVLVTFIFGSALDVDKPLNQKKVLSAVKKAGPTSNLAYNVIAGSMADSQLPNIITSFTDRPPSISSAQRFVTSSMKVITGDASAANWMTRNVGMLRDFQGLTENLDNQLK